MLVVKVLSEQEQIERNIITNYVTFKEEYETRKFNKLFAISNNQGYPDIDDAICKIDAAYCYGFIETPLSYND